MSCQLPFALPESTWRCQLPKGHYGPCAEFDYGAKLEWPNPDTPLPPETAGGRLTAEPEDRDVLAERFARDPISKEATIERLQALLADVILQRNEFFARLERVEQEAEAVIVTLRADLAKATAAWEKSSDWALLLESQRNDLEAVGRLPALEALLEETRNWDIYRGADDVQHFCDDLKSRMRALAGLRADPAPLQMIEEKDV